MLILICYSINIQKGNATHCPTAQLIASGAQAALDKRRIFAHGHQDPGFGHECLCDDDDDGWTAYSNHDKIPPWWGNVRND